MESSPFNVDAAANSDDAGATAVAENDRDSAVAAAAAVIAADHRSTATSSSQPTNSSSGRLNHSYDVPIRDAPSASRRPRRRRPRSRSRGRSYLDGSLDDTPTTIGQGNHHEDDAKPSLQDRLTATAVSGTLELLRQVGGVTWSTTGALVAPPLHVTRTLLLPSLWAAAQDYLKAVSPPRAQDWYRIASTSVHHLFHTLQHTDTGHVFRQRLLESLYSATRVASADTTRQALLDGMATWVKLAEALHTPQFRAWLEQWCVTACRLAHVAADGRTQHLWHDLRDCVWSGVEVWADPATTVALAEVTAYLAYALEDTAVNDNVGHVDTSEDKEAGGSAKVRTANQARRRKGRDRYQATTVTHKDTLEDPHVTIEEAILSSLGGVPPMMMMMDDDDGDKDNATGVPLSIDFPHNDSGNTTVEGTHTHHHDDDDDAGTTDWEQSSSIRQQVLHGDDDHEDGHPEWHDRARMDVDVPFLRDGIALRASHLGELSSSQQQQQQAKKDRDAPPPTTTASVVEDVEDLGVVETVNENDSDKEGDNDKESETPRPRRQRIQIGVVPPSSPPPRDTAVVGFWTDDPKEASKDDTNENNEKAKRRKMRLDGESSSEHFHRILDETLSQKRKDAVQAALGDTNSFMYSSKGLVRRPGVAEDTERNGTVKDRLSAIKAEMGLSVNPTKYESDRRNTLLPKTRNDRMFLLIGICILLAIATIWFVLGCYGLYTLLSAPSWTGSTLSTSSSSSAGNQEIVIRVVKEVIHTNQDGVQADVTEAVGVQTADEHEHLAKCIQAAYA